MKSPRLVRLMSLWLVLALAAAPVLPAFAMMNMAGDAHAVQVAHDNHDGATPDHSAPSQTPCTQHDACNGQCCDICAQCFNAMSLLPLEQVQPHPVLSPTLTALHPRLLVASPDRPPRFLSL
ncbi:MAG: hypothetical protein AB1560_03065 [Pseudomonadota bacterium]